MAMSANDIAEDYDSRYKSAGEKQTGKQRSKMKTEPFGNWRMRAFNLRLSENYATLKM
jgi:hypothetical protein